MTTPQQRLDSLLADVWQPTDAVVTVAEIVATVGMDPARLVVGTLQAGAAQDPILAASYQAITTVGMSLSSPERQGLIDALAAAGQWPDAVRDSVKALGGVNVKEWQRQGMAEAPTLESVQAEIDTAAVSAWWNAKSAVVNERLFEGTITTQQQVIDVMGGLK